MGESSFPDLFRQGRYDPITVRGAHAEHVIAFAREFRSQRLIVVVGRHFGRLTQGGRRWPARWEAWLMLPPGRYECLIGPRGSVSDTGVDALFGERPVSVLRMR